MRRCEYFRFMNSLVVLLDEPGVFLEQSSLDVVRSQLVTIFLRELEWFHGIFFMTTNRVGIFDKAIHSRVNIALKYNNLDVDARRAVWCTFLPPNSLADATIKRLATHQANGREIKNYVHTASIMANFRKETLGIEHLEAVLNLGTQFSEDCAKG